MAESLPHSVTEPLGAIEPALTRAIDAIGQPRLKSAMAHALLAGGKRIRPLLCWHSCVAAGGDGHTALPACIAVELVHAFSLVHDDLPAMDDDDVRRGKPTVHIAFDEATAILTGDALLALAAGVLAESPGAGRSIADLTRATLDMIEGQIIDTVASTRAAPTLEQVQQIHALKTGALIAFATSAGARAAGATDETVARFRDLGGTLGLLFQIIDDLLDEEQTQQATGKRTSKDREAGKLTFPVVLGLEQSRAEANRLAHAAERELRSLGIESGPLFDLIAWLGVRQH